MATSEDCVLFTSQRYCIFSKFSFLGYYASIVHIFILYALFGISVIIFETSMHIVSPYFLDKNQSINFIINNHQRDVTKVAKRMLFKTVAFAYGTWT